MAIITISREDGSLGTELAEYLAKENGMKLVLREGIVEHWLRASIKASQMQLLTQSPKFYLADLGLGMSVKDFIEMKLLQFSTENSCVMVGMGAQIIFKDTTSALRVKVIASDEVRTKRISQKYGISIEEAQNTIELSDKKHRKYMNTLYNIDWQDHMNFDITVNTDSFTVETLAPIVLSALHSKLESISKKLPENDATSKSGEVIFKHPAEAEFAKILDMYNITWAYEPKTFPIEWDAEGNVIMAFSPDFYLTKFDTYIEITTMEQKYVTTKNKKVRRLKELYPGININIVYKKDFISLMRRFGKGGGVITHGYNK